MSDEERTPDDVVREMLWDARDAKRLRRVVPLSLLADRAPIAAVIADHDQHRPDAPAGGSGRVQSIVAHTIALAADVDTNRTKYTDAATSLHARATGQIDPFLLRHASYVLRELPAILTGPDHPAASDAGEQ